jgi:hypothetical protein
MQAPGLVVTQPSSAYVVKTWLQRLQLQHGSACTCTALYASEPPCVTKLYLAGKSFKGEVRAVLAAVADAVAGAVKGV